MASQDLPGSGRGRGRPFEKGDPRINLKGRRKEWIDLKRVLNEPYEGGPSPVERATKALVDALDSEDRVPAAKTILAYGVGLPAQKVEVEDLSHLSDAELMERVREAMAARDGGSLVIQ